jgi:hypothetical protein
MYVTYLKYFPSYLSSEPVAFQLECVLCGLLLWVYTRSHGQISLHYFNT